MNKLLSDIVDAHGGLERWNQFETIEAELISSGELLERKVGESGPALRFSAKMHEQATVATPVAGGDKSVLFRPDRVSIETADAVVLAARNNPRAAFAGHDLSTPWDALHRAYFSGYAMWSYLTAPFSFAMKDVQVFDIEPLAHGGEVWQGISVVMPAGFATHSREQAFYFGPDLLLRRQDYTLEIAGGAKIANYALDIVNVEGIKIASKRRAYFFKEKHEVQRDRLAIALDMSKICINVAESS